MRRYVGSCGSFSGTRALTSIARWTAGMLPDNTGSRPGIGGSSARGETGENTATGAWAGEGAMTQQSGVTPSRAFPGQ